MTVETRFGPRTLDAQLVEDIWSEVKSCRDLLMNHHRESSEAWHRLDALLGRMKKAGMSDWIPTIEEVQAAWRGDGEWGDGK